MISLTKECSNLLMQAEDGRLSAETLTTLQMYLERFHGEFSTRRFQALKAKASAMGVGASRVMGVWNAAWVQCQEVRQQLEEMQKKKGVDRKQIQQSTAANPLGKYRETKMEGDRSELGEAECSLMLPQGEVNSTGESPKDSLNAACCSDNNKTELKESKNPESSLQAQAENAPESPVLPQIGDCVPENNWRPREHHSGADLRRLSSTKDGETFPSRRHLGRSLSEGMCAINLSDLSPHNKSHKHCHSKRHSLDQNLQPTHNLHTGHRENVWPENLNCESKRDEEEEGGCTGPTKSPEELETLLTPTERNDNAL